MIFYSVSWGLLPIHVLIGIQTPLPTSMSIAVVPIRSFTESQTESIAPFSFFVLYFLKNKLNP